MTGWLSGRIYSSLDRSDVNCHSVTVRCRVGHLAGSLIIPSLIPTVAVAAAVLFTCARAAADLFAALAT